jgi:signal transduction histidine kinase
MKKVPWLFVLAVLVPSVALALLAARTLSDQQFVLERQQSLLHQTVTDALAGEINDYLADLQRQFNELVEALVTNEPPHAAAAAFDDHLRAAWPMAEVGFCVTLDGKLLCPSPAARLEARVFCQDNGGFLTNRESVEVYLNDFSRAFGPAGNRPGGQQMEWPVQSPANGLPTNAPPPTAGSVANVKAQFRKISPAQPAQQILAPNEAALGQSASRVLATEAGFAQLIGEAGEGLMARFVQNKLRLMFWHRLAREPQLVFGAQLDLTAIGAGLQSLLDRKLAPPGRGSFASTPYTVVPNRDDPKPSGVRLPEEICVLILNDTAAPAAISDAGVRALAARADRTNPEESFAAKFRQQFKTDLKRPFVATEIGEALPHWEVAAYLKDPDALKRAALNTRLTLGLLIALLLIAMIVGSFLIVNDLNRQMSLARQKTDFVSNVSHELKTPLTSIRMFSELLAEGRVQDEAKQRNYLHIISAEAARLTRLINNVLDFARLERGEKKYNFQDCDLTAVVRETAGSFRPHLENHGFTLECRLGDAPLRVRGDADALAQILVNLLSNAEKYSGERRQIELELRRHDTPLPYAEVRVLDRGLGVPAGSEEKIFENFYRAHDSLASGIQGSGLGLTLARQMARAHGGDVVFERREGGGSCFALRLPLLPGPATADGNTPQRGS